MKELETPFCMSYRLQVFTAESKRGEILFRGAAALAAASPPLVRQLALFASAILFAMRCCHDHKPVGTSE